MEIKLLQWACQLTWKSWTDLPFSEGKPVSDPSWSFKRNLVTCCVENQNESVRRLPQAGLFRRSIQQFFFSKLVHDLLANSRMERDD